MPEKDNKTIAIFNPANTKLLREHMKAFRERRGLDLEPMQTQQIDTITTNRVPTQSVENLEEVPIQKPELPKNRYGRTYYGHMLFDPNGIGPKIVENGGNI